VKNSSLTMLPGATNSTTTINSLYITGNGGITFNGDNTSGQTLVIGSGGIISNGALDTATVNGNTSQPNTEIIGKQDGNVNGFNAGFITSSTGELVITAANQSGVRIAST